MSRKMRIGELAEGTGFGTKTIRYYEQIGLLSEPPRSESGYRLYSEEDRQRLDFIAKAKRLGFSLEDIRDVLILHEQQQTPCRHVLALLEQKLSQVDGALKELRQFRGELARLRHEASERLASQAAEVEAPLLAVLRRVDRRVRSQDSLGDSVLVCLDELGEVHAGAL